MDTDVNFDQYKGRSISVNYFESDRWVDGRLVRQVSLGEDLEFLVLELESGSEFLVDLQHVIAVEVRPTKSRVKPGASSTPAETGSVSPLKPRK